MIIKTLLKILKNLFNRKAIKDPKPLNATTIKYFIQGHLRSLGKRFGITEEHILEQSSWREEQVKKKSIECFSKQECIHCECSLNETLLSDAACKHGCFPEMMTKEQWDLFKQSIK